MAHKRRRSNSPETPRKRRQKPDISGLPTPPASSLKHPSGSGSPATAAGTALQQRDLSWQELYRPAKQYSLYRVGERVRIAPAVVHVESSDSDIQSDSQSANRSYDQPIEEMPDIRTDGALNGGSMSSDSLNGILPLNEFDDINQDVKERLKLRDTIRAHASAFGNYGKVFESVGKVISSPSLPHGRAGRKQVKKIRSGRRVVQLGRYSPRKKNTGAVYVYEVERNGVRQAKIGKASVVLEEGESEAKLASRLAEAVRKRCLDAARHEYPIPSTVYVYGPRADFATFERLAHTLLSHLHLTVWSGRLQKWSNEAFDSPLTTAFMICRRVTTFLDGRPYGDPNLFRPGKRPHLHPALAKLFQLVKPNDWPEFESAERVDGLRPFWTRLNQFLGLEGFVPERRQFRVGDDIGPFFAWLSAWRLAEIEIEDDDAEVVWSTSRELADLDRVWLAAMRYCEFLLAAPTHRYPSPTQASKQNSDHRNTKRGPIDNPLRRQDLNFHHELCDLLEEFSDLLHRTGYTDAQACKDLQYILDRIGLKYEELDRKKLPECFFSIYNGLDVVCDITAEDLHGWRIDDSSPSASNATLAQSQPSGNDDESSDDHSTDFDSQSESSDDLNEDEAIVSRLFPNNAIEGPRPFTPEPSDQTENERQQELQEICLAILDHKLQTDNESQGVPHADMLQAMVEQGSDSAERADVIEAIVALEDSEVIKVHGIGSNRRVGRL
ncbi:hypothetical protein HII31_10451 [Pseudocercospora fuligena]|uniref:Uncharacterized protein n=1 Tax=Pseudocercospora fuligena TaxID=685502 RepID=A0A8H6RDQ7_9PEZI|nr:hypothetical protein HII31_10451 [Pseudocercospora fuligena]